MFSTRKLSPLAFATAAGSAILIMIATPLTASADSPWDNTDPIVVAGDDDDSPWDRIQIVADDGDGGEEGEDDDSPWD